MGAYGWFKASNTSLSQWPLDSMNGDFSRSSTLGLGGRRVGVVFYSGGCWIYRNKYRRFKQLQQYPHAEFQRQHHHYCGRWEYQVKYVADADGSGGDNQEGSNSSEIRISDATYTSRNVYILLDSASSGNDKTDGVYVDGTNYGEFVFDVFNNTQTMEFTDGTTIELTTDN